MRVAAVLSSRPVESLEEVTELLSSFVDKHRESAVVRVVEIKRLLDVLTPRSEADHEQQQRPVEQDAVEGKGKEEEQEEEDEEEKEEAKLHKKKRAKKSDA